MIDKIIKKVKETERTADNIIKEAENKSVKIIKDAQNKTDDLLGKVKEESFHKGEILISENEKRAKEEAENINKNCKKEKELLQKKAFGKIENAVKIITKRVVEGK